MSDSLIDLRIVAKAVPDLDGRPRELSRNLAPYPLHYQELLLDPEHLLDDKRLMPEALNNATADEMCWKVRREGILRHTGELPIETTEGGCHRAELCALPMYDRERLIPRGKLIDIPVKPRRTDPTSPRTKSKENA